jgi:hypothetical protein
MPENACREKEQSTEEREQRFKDDADGPEGKRQEPYEWSQDEDHDGERPRYCEQQTPGNEEEEHFHENLPITKRG